MKSLTLNGTNNFSISDLSILLPDYISLQDNINGQIPDVEISYNGILLTSFMSFSSKFIITGFKTTTINEAGINSNRNKIIANRIDQLFNNNNLNISAYNNMISYTAAQALYSYSLSLQNAIISAIINMFKNDVIYASGIAYNFIEIANAITVTSPQSISIQDNVNAQIPDVTLKYNNQTLEPENANSDLFTISGFKLTSINQTGINYNRNQQVATTLDSLLGNTFNSYESQYYNY
ncbi:hypothetical protein IKS57_02000 [bacterium]|nr:hypothetical protein [bacterium]